MKKILLMGNPNVGKSVVFSRLTGVRVISSNYPGTTVEYTKGVMKLGDENAEVIDIPGTYTLEPISKAEEVAVEMITRATSRYSQGNVVVNVLDATNMERNLNLTLQLIKKKIPIIIALNLWDETKHIGITIDIKKLEELLGVPVVPTCAISGEGIKELVTRIPEAKAGSYQYRNKERWHELGKIVTQVQKITHRHHTLLDRLEDISIKPLSGISLALLVLYSAFYLIRFIGESLIDYVFNPLFEKLWTPLMIKLSATMDSASFIHEILIGKLVEGKINYVESLGLLTTGFYVPFAMVLPYVCAFYFILGIAEDSGYLPRVGVLLDNLMHRLGLHGLAIIPMMLGLGCNVPGALATRVLETRRERFIAATLMAIAVPCMALQAMIISLVGKHGAQGIGIVFGTLFLVWIILGILLNSLIKGRSPEIFIEIPPYRIPYLTVLLKKLWMRIRWFLQEAIPFVFLGVIIVNIAYSLRIIELLGKFTEPLISGILGLPAGAVGALIIGFLRKDVAVGMLQPLGLSLKQLIIASVVLAMYFPCIATFAVLMKELGLKDMIKSVGIMILSTIIVGGILNLLL
jgi:ferrous iron transport protein B